jgi:protein-disulfide isomerase
MVMKQLVAVASLAALGFVNSPSGYAQTTEEFNTLREEIGTLKEIQELRREIEGLKAGQQGVQKDLQEIKSLLQNRPAAAAAAPGAPTVPQNLVLDIAEAPVKGEKDAKLALVEFTDFQCPFCGRHVRETVPQIEKDYVETGKLKYVVQDFPLESIHKNAFKAAEAARCAQDQGKYWEMHERLFANQQALGPADLVGYAQALGLNVEGFKPCLDEDTYAAAIRKDMAEGQKAGVTGTPAFFLGVMEGADGKVKVVRNLSGAQPFSAFQAAIDSALAEQK